VTQADVRLRAAAPGDAAAVAKLVNERELIDRGVTEVTAAEIAGEWSTPEIDLAVDGLIGEIDGRVIAAALATRDREYVYVSGDCQGRGLGARLLVWVMARSMERGAVRHRQVIGSGNQGAAQLLTAAGYEPVRAFHRMGLALGAAEATTPPPERGAVEIRRIDPDRDARELHRLDAAAFAGNADYEPETFEQFRAEHLLAADLDPAATLAATDGGRIVGFLVGARRRGGTVGYVSILAVDPEARRRGLGSALLGAAFAVWIADGLAVAELTVASDNPRAFALYEHHGMASLYSMDCYERPLRRAD
jgi:ribosomal protein S18 acetylase RimI-like enzyme